MFEESGGRGGRGYTDGALPSFVLSVRSSIFKSTKWDIESADATIDVNMNIVIARDNEGKVVMIDVDAMGEWDGSCAPILPILGYGWAPHEVGEYISYFNTRYSLENLLVDWPWLKLWRMLNTSQLPRHLPF
ncbi:hypothetical protein V8G54_026869 [Vigna mungo]|uniref:Uncharacterized protein n=1 Tax=Vigna mungo TaxID=3915 RepID=A0AAQ3N1L1_VIGMU